MGMEDNKKKTYHHITGDERKLIEQLLKSETPKRKIARMLGRDIKTIRREIKRGSVEQRKKITTTKKDPSIPLYESKMVYFADVAQKDAEVKKHNCGCKYKFTKCQDFIEYIETQVKVNHWSIDAARGYAVENNLFTETVATNTIYNWIDLNLINIKNIDLPRKVRFRTRKKIVRKHKRLLGRSIEERPKRINERTEFGHWEGDGIVGKNHKGHWISMVERKTRMGFLFDVKDKKKERIVEVIDELEKSFGKWFPKIFKSITFDNGTEFSKTDEMERNGRTVIYYAHPYSSCERGTNENWNGIVRRFAPKGTSFKNYKTEDLQRITNCINNLPRKMFNYRTPEELFMEEIDKIIKETA